MCQEPLWPAHRAARLQLRVQPGSSTAGLVLRLPPDALRSLGARAGDVVMVTARASVSARLGAPDTRLVPGTVQMDELLCLGTGAHSGDSVELVPVATMAARRLTLLSEQPSAAAPRRSKLFSRRLQETLSGRFSDRPSSNVPEDWAGLPVMRGNLLPVAGMGPVRVIDCDPPGPVVINAGTQLIWRKAGASEDAYRDIGGLSREVARVREMVDLPLQCPELFQRLGVDPPRGLLLYGPPGCGKTLIARAVARETHAFFITVNGPEVVQKHYGESEQLLRQVFEEAQRHPAAIIFFDEIDALAPHRETVLGDVEKRIVAQLLALMDGVTGRGRIVVMAATNLPNNLDPAMRRPGRFDREIAIGAPTKAGRLEILDIHTRCMPLAADVKLERIAAVAHGFLGADLAALCREAAMASAREQHRGGDLVTPMTGLFVHMRHFQEALSGFRLSTIRELSSDIPERRWDEVGGLAAARQRLREALEWPQAYGARFDRVKARPPRGILLTGPSGTGKTLLAQAVGSNTDQNFIVVHGPELLSKWVGDTERGIRDLFDRARRSAPTILFIDEIDAIAPTRGASDSNAQIADRMVGQLLLELDRNDTSTQVTVLAATNRPDRVDPALRRPGRFDAIIVLPLPDEQDRFEVLTIHCREGALGADADLKAVAQATAGRHGAELAGLCQRAKMLAIAESIQLDPHEHGQLISVDQRHFLAAIGELTAAAGPPPRLNAPA